VLSLTGGGPAGEALIGKGVNAYAVRLDRYGFACIPALRRILRAVSPDLIQGWMYYGNIMAVLAGSLLQRRPPVAWGIRHGLPDLSKERRSTRLAVRLSARLSTRVAAAVYASTDGIGQHRAAGFRDPNPVVISNGFDLDYFRPRPDAGRRVRRALGLGDEALVVGHVARFDPAKNHAGFLRAAAQVAGAVPECSFVLAGPGVEASNSALTALITGLGLQDRVRLLGSRTDIPELMSSFDVFCLSSRSEAFPNVLAEASACAVPSVATDVGDVRAILGASGSVIPPDDEQELGAALIRALRLPGPEREADGCRARAVIRERFSLARAVEQYSELYSALAQASAGAGRK
jgi:glycosyltransferase involved in cell wall biosynthesis